MNGHLATSLCFLSIPVHLHMQTNTYCKQLSLPDKEMPSIKVLSSLTIVASDSFLPKS
jgi:hypothetical protein